MRVAAGAEVVQRSFVLRDLREEPICAWGEVADNHCAARRRCDAHAHVAQTQLTAALFAERKRRDVLVVQWFA